MSKKKEVTYSAKSDRHGEHKHLFGTGGNSDFIINMSAEGAQKLCGIYSMIAMILIAVSAVPYYISKLTEQENELNRLITERGQTLAFLIMTLLVAAGFIGMLIFMIACVKKEIVIGKNKSLWLFAGILLSALISTLASDEIGTSLFGYLDRAEGLITIIGYIGFFTIGMTLTNEVYRRRTADTIVVIGTVNAVMGILQSIPKLSKWIPSFYNFLFRGYLSEIDKAEYFNSYAGYDASYAADGFCCSPFALGALLTIAFAFAVNNAAYGGFIARLLNIAAAAVMSGATIVTQTFPAMLGIACVLAVQLILAIAAAVKERKAEIPDEEKHGKAPVLTVVLCGVLTVAILGGIVATDNFRMRNERIMYTDAYERLGMGVAIGRHTEKNGEGIYPTLWYDASLCLQTNNMLIGIGPDNWGTMYNGGEGMVIDRCYNEYLDMALTRGLLGAGLYIAMLIVTLVKAARMLGASLNGKVSKTAVGVFTAFIAYAVQAFFNISSASCTPFFYLVIGIIWSYEAAGRLNTNKDKKKK